MSDRYLITAALLYANGAVHFGHLAGAYLPADAYTRYRKLRGDDAVYICGSDEYGVAITLSAELASNTPKEHVDFYHKLNMELFKKLNINFDHYSRTTHKEHDIPVQEFFLELVENGYIEEKVTEQLYSEQDNKFLADRYVIGTCPKCKAENARGDECPSCAASYEATDLIDPRSKMTNSPLVLKPTKNWFMRFDLFKDKLLTWLSDKKWKPNVLNFVEEYVKDLRPRAITRDSTWGVKIPLPDTEGKVLYVWFDAPIGYISATKEWAKLTKNEDAWKDYWLDPSTKLIHFIGKDNIPFHAIFFPAMCMGQNKPYKLVDEIPANEFLNLEGKQFSKSAGWYIDLEKFLDEFSADQVRYTLAANAPESSDSEFTFADFQMRCNTELVGKFGNLVNRTLVFAKKQTDLKVPVVENLEEIDEKFLKDIEKLTQDASAAYESFSLRKATHVIMELAALGNVYFDAKKPWVDAKQDETRHRMQNTIALCLVCLKQLALISAPIVPEASKELFELLGVEQGLSWDKVVSYTFKSGDHLKTPKILFAKIEDEVIEKHLEKLHSLAKA
ncbi:MAG: Methionine--tRNA ligase [Chlamydiia bacterium]|nr:Methionine--tRNA ligase [Chlamydiia bacterium]